MRIIRLTEGNIAVIGQWAMPHEISEIRTNWPAAISLNNTVTIFPSCLDLARVTADFFGAELLIQELRNVSRNSFRKG